MVSAKAEVAPTIATKGRSSNCGSSKLPRSRKREGRGSDTEAGEQHAERDREKARPHACRRADLQGRRGEDRRENADRDQQRAADQILDVIGETWLRRTSPSGPPRCSSRLAALPLFLVLSVLPLEPLGARQKSSGALIDRLVDHLSLILRRALALAARRFGGGEEPVGMLDRRGARAEASLRIGTTRDARRWRRRSRSGAPLPPGRGSAARRRNPPPCRTVPNERRRRPPWRPCGSASSGCAAFRPTARRRATVARSSPPPSSR